MIIEDIILLFWLYGNKVIASFFCPFHFGEDSYKLCTDLRFDTESGPLHVHYLSYKGIVWVFEEDEQSSYY